MKPAQFLTRRASDKSAVAAWLIFNKCYRV